MEVAVRIWYGGVPSSEGELMQFAAGHWRTGSKVVMLDTITQSEQWRQILAEEERATRLSLILPFTADDYNSPLLTA